jgi:hypothetical protein
LFGVINKFDVINLLICKRMYRKKILEATSKIRVVLSAWAWSKAIYVVIRSFDKADCPVGRLNLTRVLFLR